MIIKMHTEIFLEVEDKEQAEHACGVMDTGLETQLNDFPVGEVIGVNVSHFEEAKQEQLEELGLVE